MNLLVYASATVIIVSAALVHRSVTDVVQRWSVIRKQCLIIMAGCIALPIRMAEYLDGLTSFRPIVFSLTPVIVPVNRPFPTERDIIVIALTCVPLAIFLGLVVYTSIKIRRLARTAKTTPS
jgi:hypothetical protein